MLSTKCLQNYDVFLKSTWSTELNLHSITYLGIPKTMLDKEVSFKLGTNIFGLHHKALLECFISCCIP